MATEVIATDDHGFDVLPGLKAEVLRRGLIKKHRYEKKDEWS